MEPLRRVPHVERVQVVRPHTIELHFDDRMVRTLEFVPHQGGPMYAPLEDPRFFERVTVDHGTVTWPNGLDLDPVVLHGDREPVGELPFRAVGLVAWGGRQGSSATATITFDGSGETTDCTQP